MAKKAFLISVCFGILFSCKKERPIVFFETAITPKSKALIEVIYPTLKETSLRDKKINATLVQEISKSIQLGDTLNPDLSINDAASIFNKEFELFQHNFPDSQMQWSTTVDSEVLYQSPDVFCVGINTYINTGGAHGNSYIKFLNFDPKTGNTLDRAAIFIDTVAVSKLAKHYFIKETQAKEINGKIQDYFWDKNFHLPQEIGFNEEGLLLLYNVYEAASYAQGLIEFTIPFEEVKPLLKVY